MGVMKKTVFILVGLLLIMQGFFNLNPSSNVNAAAISDNILTSAEIKVTKGGVEIPLTQPLEISSDMRVTLNYTWELPNSHTYVSGDTFEFDLPKELQLLNGDVTGDLSDPDMTDGKVGTFTATASNNKVVMTFDEDIENDNVKGTLTFTTTWNESKLVETTQEIELFHIGSSGPKVTVHLVPHVSSTIEKQGTPNKTVNADRIDWTIDVNKKLQTLDSAIVDDNVPEGLTLDASSVKVYPLTMKYDGTSIVGNTPLTEGDESADYKLLISPPENDFSIKFNHPINSAYRITYSTAISESKTSFLNTATLENDNGGFTPVSASATVNSSYGQLLEKTSSYDAVNQKIKWTIKFNYGEEAIAQLDAVLTDLFDDSQQLLGSVHVYPVTVTGMGTGTQGTEINVGAGPNDYTFTSLAPAAGKEGFTIQFNSPIHSAYDIEYETEPDLLDVYNTVNVTNKVTSGTKFFEKGQSMSQQYGIKSLISTDYSTKRLKWKIDVNKNNNTMDNVVITDTFTGGHQKIVSGSFKIDGIDPVPADFDLQVTQSSDSTYTTGFTLTALKQVTQKFTITYETEFFNDAWGTGTIVNAKNSAKVAWNYNGSHEVTTNSPFNPNNNAKNNGYKNGSYNPVTKQITWNIGINYNSKTLSAPELIDPLESGQTLQAGTLEVKPLTVDASGNVVAGAAISPDDYVISVTPGNELHVKFKSAINSPYLVTFKTSLDLQIISDKVENTAKLFDGSDLMSGNLYAKVNIPHGTEYVSKTGTQAGSKINWKIYINRGQSHVLNAKVIDDSSDGQLLDESSFHLFEATVASNGDAEKDPSKELVKGTDYSLAITTTSSGGQQFVLSFINAIDTPYVLEYQSTILADDGDPVSNSVKFEGDGVNVTTVTSEKVVWIGSSSGSGSASGNRGNLTVKKVDTSNHTTVLAGAVFKLQRKLSNGTLLPAIEMTTDATGQALFTSLRYGTYILTETIAPSGYTLDSTPQTVTINSASQLKTITNLKQPVSPPVTPDPTPEPTEPPVTPEPTPEPTEPPVTPEPTPEPTNPPEPTESVKPTEETPTGVEIIDEEVPLGTIKTGNGKTLPQTGEPSHLPIQLAGLGLLVIGIVLFLRKKRSNS